MFIEQVFAAGAKPDKAERVGRSRSRSFTEGRMPKVKAAIKPTGMLLFR